MAEKTSDPYQHAFKRTKFLSSEWKQLGTLLKVPPYRLNEIESNHPKNAVKCRMEMLHAWVNSDPKNPEKELDTAMEDLLQMKSNSNGE